jgi:hypothetical protein
LVILDLDRLFQLFTAATSIGDEKIDPISSIKVFFSLLKWFQAQGNKADPQMALALKIYEGSK